MTSQTIDLDAVVSKVARDKTLVDIFDEHDFASKVVSFTPVAPVEDTVRAVVAALEAQGYRLFKVDAAGEPVAA